jgi:universal stress protein E
MKLLQKILVPVDFNESSNKAMDAAMLLAKTFHSQITLLHVISVGNIPKESEGILEQYSRENLQTLASRIREDGIEVADTIIRKGVPFENIILVAQTMDFNVIVAGAGNKKEDEIFRLGTTVEKLIRKNQVPLWVVKNEPLRPIKKILCPVDFSDASKRAMGNAVTLAKNFQARLTVLNVFTPINIVSPRFNINNDAENRQLRKKQQKDYHDFIKGFDLGSIQHEVTTLDGEPHREILKTIQNGDFNLLLMGTSGRTGLSRILMGSVTEKVIREVPCSFITTKARDLTDDFFESNINDIEGILKAAREQYDKGAFESAAGIYLTGIRQYPDNIPLIKGLISAYHSIGNQNQADYYRKYAREIIKRTWGDEYLGKMDIDPGNLGAI